MTNDECIVREPNSCQTWLQPKPAGVIRKRSISSHSGADQLLNTWTVRTTPSPHPGPLPKGEGESSAAFTTDLNARACRETVRIGSLSPKERVGVRGKRAAARRLLKNGSA